jgi:hypothetical protein
MSISHFKTERAQPWWKRGAAAHSSPAVGRPLARCEDCQQEFRAKTRRAQFCSGQCRLKSWRAQQAARREGWRCCAACGWSFRSSRSSRLYCSAACTQRAYRARKEARELPMSPASPATSRRSSGARPPGPAPVLTRVKRLAARVRMALHQVTQPGSQAQRAAHRAQFERAQVELHHALALIRARNQEARERLVQVIRRNQGEAPLFPSGAV